MNKKELQAIAQAAAKNIKTEADLNEFRQMLTKITVETALNTELDDHLDSARQEPSGTGNSRNGYTSKTLQTEDGQFELNTPRDRAGSFEPQLVKKHQRRFTSMDDKILFLYAQGMTTREIVKTFKDLYGADVSPTLISKVTDAVIEQVVEWQSRPLDPVYPIVYLDCIVVKIRQDKRVINKAIHLALGVNLEGHKELLGLWLTENEGAKFWLNVLTELQNRGVKDILIACVDGLKGFPDAISTAFPDTQIQLCIVHMVRNSIKYVPWKDYKLVTADLKHIYQSVTEEEALLALEAFAERWDEKMPDDQSILAQPLAPPEHAVPIPGGHSQGDLHHQCHRVLEQRDPQGRQETQAVSHRRLSDEGGVFSYHGCVEEMDHADPELESGTEPVYDRLRRATD